MLPGLQKRIVPPPPASFSPLASGVGFPSRSTTTSERSLYVLVNRLFGHLVNAEAKVHQIFCAKDRAQAYEEAMTGKLDDMKFAPCTNAEADNLLKVHKEIDNRVGIVGTRTPLFLIDGQIVNGANISADREDPR